MNIVELEQTLTDIIERAKAEDKKLELLVAQTLFDIKYELEIISTLLKQILIEEMGEK